MKINFKVINCFSVNKDSMNESNYISLPSSVLEQIKEKKPPYYFRIKNNINELSTYVGVLDFNANKDYVIAPLWICEYLGLENQNMVEIKLLDNCKVLKGSSVTFNPREEEFFKIDNVGDYLQPILSNFCLLHRGSIIQISIFNKKYNLKIEEIEQSWTDVNFDELDGDINENIIEIKDIDLSTFFKNDFLKVKDDKVIDKIEDKNEEVDINDVKEETNEETIPAKRNIEDVRKARLAYFDKKFKK